jgi:hypothetical protein
MTRDVKLSVMRYAVRTKFLILAIFTKWAYMDLYNLECWAGARGSIQGQL